MALDNFRFIFLFFFLICSLVFVLFVMHHLVKFTKKRASLFLLYLQVTMVKCTGQMLKAMTDAIRLIINGSLGLFSPFIKVFRNAHNGVTTTNLH